VGDAEDHVELANGGYAAVTRAASASMGRLVVQLVADNVVGVVAVCKQRMAACRRVDVARAQLGRHGIDGWMDSARKSAFRPLKFTTESMWTMLGHLRFCSRHFSPRLHVRSRPVSSMPSLLERALLVARRPPASARTTLRLLLAARLVAALTAPVSDCDEAYNFWEPAHALLHRSGFQTWEYSPAYALRSYAYLWPHAAIASAVERISGSKVGLDGDDADAGRCLRYCVATGARLLCCAMRPRCCLRRGRNGSHQRCRSRVQCRRCACHAGGQSRLHGAVHFFGGVLAVILYHADNDALNSVLASRQGFLLSGPELTAIFAGWPFAAAAGIPVALDFLLVRRQWLGFLRHALVSFAVITVRSCRDRVRADCCIARADTHGGN
jgi:hypothetical protein